MYAKGELKEYKTQFWTDFKSYMSRTRSVAGRNNNWLNYPSGVKSVFIRIDADAAGARMMLDVQTKDDGVRAIIWEQMHELKAVLEAEMGTSGEWLEDVYSEAVPRFNRIIWELKGVDFINPEDKDEIFAFLKDRLVKFDRFYEDFKDVLINLVD